jgi:predicted transcriptional regulator
MKKRKYTKSQKVINKNNRIADWEKRIEIMILKNQGWTGTKIAEKFNCSHQAIYYLLKKMDKMTVEEAELLQAKAQKALD